MLVLTRKQGERIRVGQALEVSVLAIRRGRVKLGFSGPRDISIQRKEIYRPVQVGAARRFE